MKKSLIAFAAVVAFVVVYFIVTSKLIPNKNK